MTSRTPWRVAVGALILLTVAKAPAEIRFGPEGTSGDRLGSMAGERTTTESFLPMADLGDALDGKSGWEPIEAGRTPNIFRAAGDADAAAALAGLAHASLYNGALAPALKRAMGLRVAMVVGSPYVATHMMRGLAATPDGKRLAAAIASRSLDTLAPRDAAALLYAGELAAGLKGLDDATFAEIEAHFTDSEIVEMTLVVCAFDFFSRLAEGTHIPVEQWAQEPMAARDNELPGTLPGPTNPRVSLMSEAELAGAERLANDRKDPEKAKGPMGLGFASSGRAMMRCPEISDAWRACFRAGRKPVISDVLANYVSDSVSVKNECFYCQTHQLYKLHKLGVSSEQMAKARLSDSALTPEEAVAVAFARKLTAVPTQVAAADMKALVDAHGEQGALDVVLVICRFNFMNRFTGALRLPPEEGPLAVYNEVVALTKTLSAAK